MRRTALFSAALAVISGIALANDEDDPMAQLRACSLMEGADRRECLDKLSRAITSAIPSATREDRWVISQTRSPVDYSPIATATISSREDAGGSAMQLSIRCRGGRTEIAIAEPVVQGRVDDYSISYRINSGKPVQIAAAAPAFGTGVAFRTDAAALIQSFPDEGELAVHLSPRVGASRDAVFHLAGLERVRGKIATACKWPRAVAKPND